jgi:type I restriction enzyme S subunit
MDLLMSLNPAIARRICGGRKKYDYRRSIFKRKVNHIYIYSSFPVKKIVCRFACSGYLSGSVDEIWDRTWKSALAAESEYRDYLKGVKVAYAIPVEDLVVFDPPLDPYRGDPGFRPPQSFRYLRDGEAARFGQFEG